VLEFGGHEAEFLTSNLVDPSIAGGASGIATDHVPVREFTGNVGYASGVGLSVWYNLRNANHDALSIFEDSTFWNNEMGGELMYSHSIVLQDLTILHHFSDLPAVGVRTNSVSKDLTYDNLTIRGYDTGVEAAWRGYTLVNGGAYATKIGVAVRNPAEPGRLVTVQGSFTLLPLPSEVLKTWTQLDVSIKFDSSPLNYSIDHLFYDSKVILNYGPFQNRQLYSTTQSANAVPFPEAGAYIPDEFVGLTTQQIKLQYGLTLLGEIAPSNVVTLPTLRGLLNL
jgi:hypothetical protein